MRHASAATMSEASLEVPAPSLPGKPSRHRRLRELDVPRETVRQFRDACEQRTAYIVRISSSQGGKNPQSVLWDRPTLIVGRGADCDLRLPHAEISRQHTYFQILGDRIFCADLGSRTGTHWSNGASQAGWINTNEPVSLGPYSLTFERTPLPADDDVDERESSDAWSTNLDDAEMTDEDGTPGNEPMFLHFVNAGQKIKRYRVTRDVTLIGSGDGVKIHLSHPSVSPVHCSVVRTPRGLWLVDLLSTDGTIVNGQIEPLAELRSGEEFQVGRFLVAVQYGESDVEQVEATTGDVSSHDQLFALRSFPSPASGMVDASPPDANPAEPDRLNALSQLAHLTADRPMQNGVPAPVEGLSEQFVLNIIKELGVMQQQALKHAQDTMRETMLQLSSTYQQRINTLEEQHAALRDRLHRLRLEPDPHDAPRLPSPE
ncbi:MAG: FHA domain-containing protein, partial [Planctomycetaceae bacterium]|nr:FHA domain-containing protein [Planctomycetaceae bacterium]